MRLEDMTIDTVEPLVGSIFHTPGPQNEPIELKLTAVARVMERVRSKKLNRQPFSMYFEGPPDVFFRQQTYPLTHPDLGEVNIFIVPLGKTENEAVFT